MRPAAQGPGVATHDGRGTQIYRRPQPISAERQHWRMCNGLQQAERSALHRPTNLKYFEVSVPSHSATMTRWPRRRLMQPWCGRANFCSTFAPGAVSFDEAVLMVGTAPKVEFLNHQGAQA